MLGLIRLWLRGATDVQNINSPFLPSESVNGTSKAKWGCVNPPQPASGLKCDQSLGCTDR